MPLVFVHGVAHRITPESKAESAQRTALFKRLVLPSGAQVFDPDWGSQGVKFNTAMPWLPKKAESFGGAVAFGSGSDGEAADGSLGDLVADDPRAAIDLAFEAALAARAAHATSEGDPSAAIDEETVATFAAAVEYLESDEFDPAEFADVDSVQSLVDRLAERLAPIISKDDEEIDAEGMGAISDALQWARRGIGHVVGAARNAAATPLLRLGRAPLSRGLAYFLGDIFVYLQERGSEGAQNRIFAAIAEKIVEAAKLRSDGDPLILVAHSLGGVIIYDLLTDPQAVAAIEEKIGAPLRIDALVTVGSQPSFFADLGLYRGVERDADGLFPKPVPVRAWMNVYDDTDVLSFACKPLFAGVNDFQYDNVTGLLDAHTAYFQRPSFYQRLRKRLADVQ
jgi:hypothetical protein